MRSTRRTKYLVLWSILGPGLIAGTADNDPSGIAGYSLAGAHYGYSLLWILIPVFLALFLCQDMCARMAAVTGKGLADLIRERFGVRVTLLAMGTLLVANLATTVSEFAGIVSATSVLAGEAARWVVVPVSVAACWWLIARGDYKRFERILIAGAAVLLAYIPSAFLAKPDWSEVGRSLTRIQPPAGGFNAESVIMIVQIIGTTITPWGLFYIQSAMRDKGIRLREIGLARADVGVGSFYTVFIAFFVLIACAATLYVSGIRVEDAAQAAVALEPAAGHLARFLFAFGLLCAGLYGAIIVPLSTSYAVTESLGTESSLGRRVAESPLFIGLYLTQVVVGAAIALSPGMNLLWLIILPNVVGAVLLPIILVMIYRLVNDRALMGEHVNTRLYNALAMLVVSTLVVLSVAMLVMQFV